MTLVLMGWTTRVHFQRCFPVSLRNVENYEKQYLPDSKIDHKISLHIKEIHPKWIVRHEDPLSDLFKSSCVRSVLCPIQSGSNRILELMQRESIVSTVFLMLTANCIKQTLASRVDDTNHDRVSFRNRKRF